jgi:hypothetical protein
VAEVVRRAEPRAAIWARAVLVGWLLLTCVGTLPAYGREPGRPVNLDIGRHVGWHSARGVAYVIANVLLFVIFGLLASYAFPRARPWSVVLVGAIISLGIEVTQYVTAVGRQTDVNDVLCNTAGAAIGVALVVALRARRTRAEPSARGRLTRSR